MALLVAEWGEKTLLDFGHCAVSTHERSCALAEISIAGQANPFMHPRRFFDILKRLVRRA